MFTVDETTSLYNLNYETYIKAIEPSDLSRELSFPEQIFFPFSEILLNIPDNVGCGLGLYDPMLLDKNLKKNRPS